MVPPESGMSTYGLMSLCNAAIIYGTKMGVELTSRPAGHRGRRGVDPQQGADPRRQLAGGILPAARTGCRSPAGSAPAQLARARRYAYHFFFNRMIPLPFIEPKAGYPIYRLKLESLQQLLPGQSPGLDTICDGILRRTAFVLRDRPRPPETRVASSALTCSSLPGR